jgi:NADH-quinone oxidoreductase subunit E
MKPKGRNVIRVCMGTACYVRGGKEALERLERHLGVPVDSITPDRRFSLEQVRCLGACGVAPVVVVNQDTHRAVMADAVVDLVEQYE